MSIDQDATSLKYLPSSSAQWTEMLAGTGLSNPAHLYLLQEASGNPTDSIGGKNLTASGTLAYQQSVPGWSRLSIKTTAATTGTLTNNTFGNVNANSYTLLLLARATTIAAVTRTLVRMGASFDDDATLEFNGTAQRLQVGEGDGTRSLGTTDPANAVHFYILRIDDSANTVDGFLDGTKIVGGTQSCNGTELLFGGDNGNTWFPANTDYMYAAVWTSALSDSDIAEIVDRIDNGPPVAAPTLTDGTTASALQSGSVSIKFTAVIEGCPYIFTDATAQQAIDAWSGNTSTHHYTQALSGLFVSGDLSAQQLDWRNPFPRGGSIMLHVSPDAADTFGKFVFKRDAGAQTELAVTADRDDTTLTVKSTTGFDASGEVWIGTECIGYSGKTGTTFTGCTRGKYAPVARLDDADDETLADGWSQTHRVGENELEVLLNPLVTSIPRKWGNKWVALYVHKYDPATGLNSRDDALLAFVGRIVAVTDDPATGCTMLEIKHVLDVVAEHTVGGRDQWSARLPNEIFLAAGLRFRFHEYKISGGTQSKNTADDLVVVSGAPANANEMQEGYYGFEGILSAVNGWLASESGSSNIDGAYSMGFLPGGDNFLYGRFFWLNPASSSSAVYFELGMPGVVRLRFGFDEKNSELLSNGKLVSYIGDAVKEGGSQHMLMAPRPYRRGVFGAVASGGVDATSRVVDEAGTYVDQFDYLPGAYKPTTNLGDGWGVFVVENSLVMFGYLDTETSGGNAIYNFLPLPEQFGYTQMEAPDADRFYFPLKVDQPDSLSIKQIFVLEMGLADALMRVFYSTGTSEYNSSYDTLAHGLGIGLPGEILPLEFRQSCNALADADKAVVLLIDKQIKLSTLLAGELIIRRAFLRWNTAGYLEFKTWQTPTDSNSVGTLTEANKAAPAGNIDHHRSVTTEDGGWAVPTSNIRYNRALQGDPAGNDQYRDTLTIADKAALDDLGGDGPAINIDCRGTFGDFMATGTTADSLAATFMASMPFFSQPGTFISRSIDQRYFAGFNIGDCVLYTDAYARNPQTGARGTVARPAIITRHRYSLGGARPNSDSADPQGGEVDLFVMPVNRVAAYVPCAQVDDTATSSGYTTPGGVPTLKLYAHKNSESSEVADVTRFASSDKIRIIEIDPSNPASPISWDRTILAVNSGSNEITLTSALSSPAWDSTKKYRVIFDDYADCQTTQQTKTFQADDADVLIQDLRSPYEFGVGGGDGNYTQYDGADPVELIPDASYGDGVGLDVGHQVALARLLNNLVMYKTGVSSPKLATSVLSFYIGGDLAAWCLVQCYPVHLGDDILIGDLYRKVAVAPHFRSSSNGDTAQVRVSLSRTPPTGPSYFDVDRGSVFDSTTFTTTSDTFATPTPVEIAAPKGGDGVVWVYVEVSGLAETWGLAYFQETSLRQLHVLGV